ARDAPRSLARALRHRPHDDPARDRAPDGAPDPGSRLGPGGRIVVASADLLQAHLLSAGPRIDHTPELTASIGVLALLEGKLERVVIPGLAFDVHQVAGLPARSGAAGGGLPGTVGGEGHNGAGLGLGRAAADLPAGGLPRAGEPCGMVGPSFGRDRRGVPRAGREPQAPPRGPRTTGSRR